MSYWMSQNWPVGGIAEFKVETKARLGRSPGTYAMDPRLWKDGVAYRPTSILIRRESDGSADVRIQFGGTEIAVAVMGEIMIQADPLRQVDTVGFRGRINDITADGPAPEPEPEPGPGPAADALGDQFTALDWEALREAMA